MNFPKFPILHIVKNHFQTNFNKIKFCAIPKELHIFLACSKLEYLAMMWKQEDTATAMDFLLSLAAGPQKNIFKTLQIH